MAPATPVIFFRDEFARRPQPLGVGCMLYALNRRRVTQTRVQSNPSGRCKQFLYFHKLCGRNECAPSPITHVPTLRSCW